MGTAYLTVLITFAVQTRPRVYTAVLLVTYESTKFRLLRHTTMCLYSNIIVWRMYLDNIFRMVRKQFQQTRKLMIGIMQKIVYDEFLPAFLSPTAMEKNELASSKRYKYDSQLDPTTANVFGIAYRMGHSWIPTFMSVFTKNFQPFRETLLNLTFFDPSMTYIQSVIGGPSGMQGLAYALSALDSQKTDRVIEDTVRNHLFVNTPIADKSFDLASLNIQRGRDHGLPSYNEFRKWCGLSSVSSWKSSSPGGLVDHTLETIYLLKAAGYSSPQDIDFFAGALSEKPVSGGTLGPTMECIIGDQFRRLKFGDRFFYQNKDTGFNKEQQAAIQNYSLASLLCQNYKFNKIHFPNVFKQADPLKSCQQIADIDLQPFCVSSAAGLGIPITQTAQTSQKKQTSHQTQKSLHTKTIKVQNSNTKRNSEINN
ncbi:peroxidase-like protein 3 [Dreissena polymorpha]|uniref:peroxidase-like protein 3 n=1 Tax=Dreissena polymorpha TaxID=45954 RepID=UPI002264DADF|nr:peroxidase-like protein 3 [Dreissena polymorpha]